MCIGQREKKRGRGTGEEQRVRDGEIEGEKER